MKPVKIFAVGKDKADVICPSCGNSVVVALDDCTIVDNCEIECICGVAIPIIIEKEEVSSTACSVDRNLFLEK